MIELKEVEDVISRLGLYIDSKEWAKLEDVLDKQVELDYRSLFGGSVEKIPGSEVIARWKSLLTPLKATQHMIVNMLVTLESNDMLPALQTSKLYMFGRTTSGMRSGL